MLFWLMHLGEQLPVRPDTRLMRTGLIAKQLLLRGHTVNWVTSAFDHIQKNWRFAEDTVISPEPGLTILAFRGCGYRNNTSIFRYIDHIRVAAKFRRALPRLDRPDLILASMPCYFMADVALRYAKANGVPIHVDARDFWPDIFYAAVPRWLSPLVHVALARDEAMVRRLFGQADSLSAMSQGVLDWAIHKGRRCQKPLDQVFYLGYQPQAQLSQIPPWLAALDGKLIAAYVGTFGVSYELPLILEAAREFRDRGRTDVHFVIAGTGGQERNLRQAALGLPNVTLPGWLGSSEIAALLSRSALGLMPYRDAVDWLPNKTFEYMAYGLPILSSIKGELANMIVSENLGGTYAAGDRGDFIAGLERILNDAPQRTAMARAARAFFLERGDADRVYSAYAEHLISMAEAKAVRNS